MLPISSIIDSIQKSAAEVSYMVLIQFIKFLAFLVTAGILKHFSIFVSLLQYIIFCISFLEITKNIMKGVTE